MSIGNIGESMRRIIPDKPADQFGKDITGAENPVRNRTIAQEGEDNAVDKKKSSVLKSVLTKIIKKKGKK
jgi:hypothetical protein